MSKEKNELTSKGSQKYQQPTEIFLHKESKKKKKNPEILLRKEGQGLSKTFCV